MISPSPLVEMNGGATATAKDDAAFGDSELVAPPTAGGGAQEPLVEGVQYAHVTSSQQKVDVKAEDTVDAADGIDLGDLMAQLKGIQS